MPASVRLKSAM
jgi:hypothetical protein